MQLELVEVEGRLYGIFRLFPIDTKKGDQPNVIYTVEGDRGKKRDLKFAMYKGRIGTHRQQGERIRDLPNQQDQQ